MSCSWRFQRFAEEEHQGVCRASADQWTIDAASKRHVDEVIVSTDDPAIADVAVSSGAKVPFLRPASLAQDDSPTVDVILHALKQMPEYSEVVACSQPLHSDC